MAHIKNYDNEIKFLNDNIIRLKNELSQVHGKDSQISREKSELENKLKKLNDNLNQIVIIIKQYDDKIYRIKKEIEDLEFFNIFSPLFYKDIDVNINDNDIIKHVKNSINKATNLDSKIHFTNLEPDINYNDKGEPSMWTFKYRQEGPLGIGGTSSAKNRFLLNNMCSFANCNYLEVGSYQGSTLCSALYKNSIKALSIDIKVSEKLINNIKHYASSQSIVQIINSDSWRVDLKSITEKYNVYFYDGCHEEESHYKSLKYYYPILENTFIFIVDDYCQRRVIEGTQRSIKDLDCTILYECILPSHDCDWRNWWDGLYVSVIQKNQ